MEFDEKLKKIHFELTKLTFPFEKGLAKMINQREANIARDAWEEGRQSWFKEIGELEEGEDAFINLDAYLNDRGLVPFKLHKP